jgi:hypothetical protein
MSSELNSEPVHQEKTSSADLSVENSFPTSFLVSAPLLSSQNAGWDGIVLEHHYQPAQETPE